MDQMASSVGGFMKIDFSVPGETVITPVEFDLSASGYSLCVINTKGDHANLTDEYALIPQEMNEIAQFYGKCYLSEVDEEQFYADIPELREKIGDRSFLRAMHFFNDNARVQKQFSALNNNDMAAFLALVNQSGESSYQLLQNLYSLKDPSRQALSLALALSRRILAGDGACRVHGGGFAGTVQTYVPNHMLLEYCGEMDRIFGAGSCSVLNIRPVGGTRVEL
jgi:galactokinase